MRLEFTGTPLEYAQSLTEKELKKVIRDCKKGNYDEFADRCRLCFEHYLAGNETMAKWWSNHAELVK